MGVTSDLRGKHANGKREGNWAVLVDSCLPLEPGEGGLCTCTLGARRCSRTERGQRTYSESQMKLYAVKCASRTDVVTNKGLTGELSCTSRIMLE